MILDFNSAKRLDQIEAERRTVDADDVRSRLHANARSFVEQLFSGRAYCTAKEARIGNVHGEAGESLSIALSGPDQGLWIDHATGERGNLIHLYTDYMGYDRHRDFQRAIKELAADFLGDPIKLDRAPWDRKPADIIEERKAAYGTKPRQDNLELGIAVAEWKYVDLHNNILASVKRFEPDGTPESKTYRPYCFKSVGGKTTWQMGAPDVRPLLHLPEIAFVSTVVLCEGEKCAEALHRQGIPATTAMQGAKAPIDKTDWTPLHGKTVIIWPDADESGLNYGRKVAALLSRSCTIRWIEPPKDKPKGWDAADCIVDGRDPRELIDHAIQFERPPSRIKLLTLEEIEALEPPEWLIADIITAKGLSVLWGKSGSLKSFVAIDMAMRIATGRPWHGKDVKPGLVIYVAAEGAHGLGKRAIGWSRTKGKKLPPANIRLLPHGIVLTGDDCDALAEAVLALGGEPRLIVLDTLARTFGGGDENRQSDMNAYVNAADKLREITGAHVMIVHHSGKDEERGERGSNVLRGAADTIMAVQRDGDHVKLINEAPKGKQKDAPEFPTVALRTQQIFFQHQGQEQSTLVLMQDDDPITDVPTGPPRLTSNEQTVLDMLHQEQPLGWNRLSTRVARGSLGRVLDGLISKKLVELDSQSTDRSRLWRLCEGQPECGLT